jgi:hypothetical protein
VWRGGRPLCRGSVSLRATGARAVDGAIVVDSGYQVDRQRRSPVGCLRLVRGINSREQRSKYMLRQSRNSSAASRWCIMGKSSYR